MASTKATARETAILTLVMTRKVKGKTQYLFSEKEAIFTLAGETKARRTHAAALAKAREKKLPVLAEIDTKEGVIHKISEPAGKALEEFHGTRALLEKPEKTNKVTVSKLDPTDFNLIKYHSTLRCFKECTKIIPSYAKAKEIFDFCAKQTCSLGGPFNISPCIPFQYVIDGCYARAHKMRWIITTKYGYCCEKVFSFAVNGNDTLAVQANKWGGCCVFWWYHVAPLVRVRLAGPIVLLMVIDPGMFDKPVMLTSWLAAQENKHCSPDAHVSLYSIQPGSAYTPAGGTTSFTTDPNYTATDATLNNYKNLVTC